MGDWYPNTTSALYYADIQGNYKFTLGYEKFDECFAPPRDATGVHMTEKPWYSALINGRGWQDVDELEKDLTRLPIEKFSVGS